MKIYRIDVSDSNPSVMTEALVTAHVDFLKDLHHKQQLLFCGPCFETSSATLLVRAESKQAADELIQRDPFTTEQFYRKRHIVEIAECNIDNEFMLQASLDFLNTNNG